MFSNILVIGTGMIGSSVALALKKSGASSVIIGFDTNKKNLAIAKKKNIVDIAVDKLAIGIKKSQLIVIASPINSYRNIFQTINQTESQALITDVGSTKALVISQAEKELKYPQLFIPAHPIAGREKPGPDYADGQLFINQYVIITPIKNNRKSDIKKIKKFWQQTGAKINLMTVDDHDEIFAGVSHLPHLISMALVHYLLQKRESNQYLKYAAGGFRDFTRIAASDPQMWHDVFLANKKILLKNLSQFEKSLKSFRKMIESGKDTIHQKELFQTLAKISEKRNRWQHKNLTNSKN